MFIFVRDRENIFKTHHLGLIFDLLTNHEIAAIDECKSSQIYPESSGVF
jgi:hypothetical protein